MDLPFHTMERIIANNEGVKIKLTHLRGWQYYLMHIIVLASITNLRTTFLPYPFRFCFTQTMGITYVAPCVIK